MVGNMPRYTNYREWLRRMNERLKAERIRQEFLAMVDVITRTW